MQTTTQHTAQPAPADIRREAEIATALLTACRDDIGDDEELRTNLVAGETGLMEAIDATLERLDAVEAMAEALKTREANIAKRRERFVAAAEKMRAAIAVAMADTGLRKIERPQVTLSLGKPRPKLVVTIEADIPARYWKQPDPVLDKKSLFADAKDGPVDGVELVDGAPVLTIRRG